MSTAKRQVQFPGLTSGYRIAEADRYCCLLDEQPAPLVHEQFTEADDLINPQLLTPAKVEQMGSRFLNDWFSQVYPVVWVNDPVKDFPNPFWVSEELLARIERVRQQPECIRQLSSREIALLQQAGILLSPAKTKERRQHWQDNVARVSEKFQSDGYALLTGVIHPYHLPALRQYYRRLLETGGMIYGDSQTKRRYITHNEPVSMFFHKQLTSLTGRICQRPLKRSYVYVSAYQGGASLPRHKDRQQCEYSISLLIDFVPELSGQCPWPLHLVTSDADVTMYQSLGDAIFYRGRQLPHYRDQLPEEMSSTSILFHFVDEDFPDSLD